MRPGALGILLLGELLLMAEILHQFIGSSSHFFIGFHTSQVVQDFSHQQYYSENSAAKKWRKSMITPPVLPSFASRKGNHKSHVLAMTSPPTLSFTCSMAKKLGNYQGPSFTIFDRKFKEICRLKRGHVTPTTVHH